MVSSPLEWIPSRQHTPNGKLTGVETSEDGTSEMNSLFPFSSSKGRNRRDGERGVAWEEQARNLTGRYHNRTNMNTEAFMATGAYILHSEMEEEHCEHISAWDDWHLYVLLIRG